MPHSTRTVRLAGASLLALLLIAGAYTASGPNPFFGLITIAEAQSAEELLKEYAVKDTDTDGLPDWQEALYGTDPANPESFKAGIKDGEAVAQGLIEPKVAVREDEASTDIDSIPGTTAGPNTITERFAQTLFSQYLSNRGETQPTSEEIVSFVKAGVNELSTESVSPARFKVSDLKVVVTSDTQAVTMYAGALETVFAQNTTPSEKNELYYFQDALRDDATALTKLKDISEAYADIANGMMQLSVPQDVATSHLAIANAFMHMSEVTGDLATLKSDPLRALMGIGLYDRFANDVVSSFANLHTVFLSKQVTIAEGVPGFFIARTARNAAEAI